MRFVGLEWYARALAVYPDQGKRLPRIEPRVERWAMSVEAGKPISEAEKMRWTAQKKATEKLSEPPSQPKPAFFTLGPDD